MQAVIVRLKNTPIKVNERFKTLIMHTLQKIADKPDHTLSKRVLVKISNVSKRYKVGNQAVTALADVSLEIYEGEFLAITGTSGSGKSTLLQLIGALDKSDEGSIAIDGVLLNQLGDRQLSEFRNKTVGFVFQFFYLQPFLNLHDNLAIPALFADMPSAEQEVRIMQMASAVGLSERLNHLPKELSGGQMQRAAIARALINRPKLILADEPTGNLDSKNSAAIIDLFQKARHELDATVVIITHDQNIARQADRCIQLRDGEIL